MVSDIFGIGDHSGSELMTLRHCMVFLDIADPHATNVRGGVQREDGSWLLEGGFPAHELREVFEIKTLPSEEEGRSETSGGFVMDQLGHIPDTAEAFVWDRSRFEVVDMDGMRID